MVTRLEAPGSELSPGTAWMLAVVSSWASGMASAAKAGPAGPKEPAANGLLVLTTARAEMRPTPPLSLETKTSIPISEEPRPQAARTSTSIALIVGTLGKGRQRRRPGDGLERSPT